MWSIISMWKSPKMVALALLTALLYLVLLIPFEGLTFFGGYADFGRIGVSIPVAFSFLFGPAAAWGAAFANTFHNILFGPLDASTIFGFAGNFLLGYIPYKLWRTFTTQKPDIRNVKKLALFIGVVVMACTLCGLIIGWGLYWLGYAPFMMTTVIITLTNMLWAIVAGAILLAVTYNFVRGRKLLHTDILGDLVYPTKSLFRRIAIVVSIFFAVVCFIVGLLTDLNSLQIFPLVLISLIAALIACK
jgi:energy-coupling factor transport system substrate-specific component